MKIENVSIDISKIGKQGKHDFPRFCKTLGSLEVGQSFVVDAIPGHLQSVISAFGYAGIAEIKTQK